jgi:hypothetical protein
MKNFVVVLYKGNSIVSLLAQFRTTWQAKEFIKESYPSFDLDVCQYSEFESERFIKILKP